MPLNLQFLCHCLWYLPYFSHLCYHHHHHHHHLNLPFTPLYNCSGMNIWNASKKTARKIQTLLIMKEKWWTGIHEILTSWCDCTQYGSVQLPPPWLVSLSKLTHWHLPVFMLNHQQCQIIRFQTAGALLHLHCSLSIRYWQVPLKFSWTENSPANETTDQLTNSITRPTWRTVEGHSFLSSC